MGIFSEVVYVLSMAVRFTLQGSKVTSGTTRFCCHSNKYKYAHNIFLYNYLEEVGRGKQVNFHTMHVFADSAEWLRYVWVYTIAYWKWRCD